MGRKYTLAELQAMGAVPVEAAQPKRYTTAELQAMGGKPVNFKSDPMSYSGDIGIMGELAKRTLGFAGGVARTAAAYSPMGQLAALVNKRGPVTPAEDFGRALVGDAPSTKEYLKRYTSRDFGKYKLPIDVSMDLSKFGRYAPETGPEFTGADVIGFTGDIVSDVGATVLAKKALGKILKEGGESFFKNGFKRDDAIARQADKVAPSQLFLENNQVPFTPGGKLEGAEKILEQEGLKRAGTVADVSATGTRGSAVKPLGPGGNVIESLKKHMRISPETQDAVPHLESDLARRMSYREAPAVAPSISVSKVPSTLFNPQTGKPFITEVKKQIPGIAAVPGPTIEELLRAKTATGQTISDEAFKAFSTDAGSQYKKALAGGYKTESERLAELAIPGHGTKLAKENANISSMLSMLPDAARKDLVEASKHGITEVDAVLAALDPTAFAAKQFGKVAKMPGFYTYPGYGAYKTGKAIDAISTPALGASVGIKNIWEKMGERKTK